MARTGIVPHELAKRYQVAGYTREEYIEIRQAELRRLAEENRWSPDDLNLQLRDVVRCANSLWRGEKRSPVRGTINA